MSLECSFCGSEGTEQGTSEKIDHKVLEKFHSSRLKTKRNADLLIERFSHR